MATSASGKKPTVVVTGGDYFLGHEIARFLLSEKQGEFARLSVTLVHPEHGKDLERIGAELKKINYKDERTLVAAFGGEVDWLVLVPDPEEDTRVEDTKKLIDAAEKAGKVENILVISSSGAEAEHKKKLHEFKQVEEYVKQKCQNWVIFRLAWLSDCFHLWSTSVIEKAEFPLTLAPGREFVPIQLEDVVRAIRVVVHQKDGHQRQTYTLTGPEEIDGPKAVEALNSAIGYGEVKYQKVDEKKLKAYLRSLRDRDDNKHFFKGQPTDTEIDTILEELELIESGAAGTKTEDLAKLINKEGEPLEEFFEKNADEFGGKQTRK